MICLGSPPPKTREMDLDDLFFSRLKLLIIMTKAFLDGYPLGGEHRRQAILGNARCVESDSIELMSNQLNPLPYQSATHDQSELDLVFYQRVKLLAVMMKAVAKGFPMGGDQRKKAMQENLEKICLTLPFTIQTEDMAPTHQTKSQQILIIDDDRIVRDFVVHTIAYGSNRDVTTFESGFDAWRYIQENAHLVHTIIADKQIPDMDGLELLHQIKNEYHQILFIIMSSDSSLEMRAFQFGADAFIRKPFDVVDLFNIMQKRDHPRSCV